MVAMQYAAHALYGPTELVGKLADLRHAAILGYPPVELPYPWIRPCQRSIFMQFRVVPDLGATNP